MAGDKDKLQNAAPTPDPDADVNSPENTDGEAASRPQTRPETPDAAESQSASTKRDEGALVKEFVKRSGYKERDVLSANVERRTVVTANGGKYVVQKNGDVFVVSGPATPAGHRYVEQEPETGNLATYQG